MDPGCQQDIVQAGDASVIMYVVFIKTANETGIGLDKYGIQRLLQTICPPFAHINGGDGLFQHYALVT